MKLPDRIKHWHPLWRLDLSPRLIRLRDLRTQAEWTGVPEVAITVQPSGKSRILGIGANARPALAAHVAKEADAKDELVNVFGHPRSLFDSPRLAEQLIKDAWRQFRGNRRFGGAPIVIVCLPPNPEGGYTGVELRACLEMVQSTCSKSIVMCQRVATDQELLAEYRKVQWMTGDE